MSGQHDNDPGRGGASRVFESGGIERALARLAERRHGVASRDELRALGLNDNVIDHRLAIGRLRPMYRGVYLLASPPPPLARPRAAVLACGPEAVLSHLSAAGLWELPGGRVDDRIPEVTVPGRNPGRKTGIRVHRVRDLPADEIARRAGIPVTSPARTLLDVAPSLAAPALEQAVAYALRQRITTRGRILALIGRHPGRPGVPALRALLERPHAPAFTRSAAERHFLALVRRGGLVEPECNAAFHGYEVDFLWRQERLVVEVDGYAHHGVRTAFERDRERDAVLAAQGYTVIRVTWRQLTGRPAATLARIAQALGRAAEVQAKPRGAA